MVALVAPRVTLRAGQGRRRLGLSRLLVVGGQSHRGQPPRPIRGPRPWRLNGADRRKGKGHRGRGRRWACGRSGGGRAFLVRGIPVGRGTGSRCGTGDGRYWPQRPAATRAVQAIRPRCARAATRSARPGPARALRRVLQLELARPGRPGSGPARRLQRQQTARPPCVRRARARTCWPATTRASSTSRRRRASRHETPAPRRRGRGRRQVGLARRRRPAAAGPPAARCSGAFARGGVAQRHGAGRADAAERHARLPRASLAHLVCGCQQFTFGDPRCLDRCARACKPAQWALMPAGVGNRPRPSASQPGPTPRPNQGPPTTINSSDAARFRRPG